MNQVTRKDKSTPAGPKVLLIQPPVSRGIRAFEPLSLIYLATHLDKHGINVKIFDMAVMGKNWNRLKVELLRYKPDIIGLTSVTRQFNDCTNISILCKTVLPSIKIVLGGIHATSLPYHCMTIPTIDAVIESKGEDSLLKLVNRWFRNEDISDIPGLYFRDGCRIVKGAPYEEIDLSRINVPDRKFLKNHYESVSEYSFLPSVQTTSGCPGQCKYCAVSNRNISDRNIGNIIKELQELKNLGYYYISFCDSDFCRNYSRLIKLCKAIIRSNLNLRFFVNSCIPSFLNAPADLMYEAGIRKIFLGVESGDREIRLSMNKFFSNNDVIKAFLKAKKHNILRSAFFIIGFPGETMETIKATETLIDFVKPDETRPFLFVPFPGTEFFNNKIEVTRQLRWDLYYNTSTEPFLNKYGPSISCSIPEDELLKCYDRLVEKYKPSSPWIIRKAKWIMIRTKNASRLAKKIVAT